MLSLAVPPSHPKLVSMFIIIKVPFARNLYTAVCVSIMNVFFSFFPFLLSNCLHSFGRKNGPKIFTLHQSATVELSADINC